MKQRILPVLGKMLFGAAAVFVLAVLILPRLTSPCDPPMLLVKSDLAILQQEIDAYRLETGRYPKSLQDLVGKTTGPLQLTELPVDPWGHSYRYAAPGRMNPTGVDVWSSGPDGVDGTDDDVYR